MFELQHKRKTLEKEEDEEQEIKARVVALIERLSSDSSEDYVRLLGLLSKQVITMFVHRSPCLPVNFTRNI